MPSTSVRRKSFKGQRLSRAVQSNIMDLSMKGKCSLSLSHSILLLNSVELLNTFYLFCFYSYIRIDNLMIEVARVIVYICNV